MDKKVVGLQLFFYSPTFSFRIFFVTIEFNNFNFFFVQWGFKWIICPMTAMLIKLVLCVCGHPCIMTTVLHVVGGACPNALLQGGVPDW